MQPEYVNTLLISPSELKNESLINSNCDDKPLSNMVTTTQEIYLVKITGTALMRRLQELLYNEIKGYEDKISLEANEPYMDLLENYVKPYIKYMVMKAFLVENSFKMRNIGVVRNSDVNTAAVDLDSIKFLQHHYDTYVAAYEDRLSKYLCANKANFPELQAEIPPFMDAPTMGEDYSNTGGLWLGRIKDKGCGSCRH